MSSWNVKYDKIHPEKQKFIIHQRKIIHQMFCANKITKQYKD